MKFLDYEKSSILGCNTGNSRNGFYERDLDTSYGRLYIKVPRDRNGHFEQQLIPDYARRTDELKTTIITLYKKGITTREISDLIEKIYGHPYSPATMSNISKAVADQVENFHKRQLSERYAVIFMDATYLNVRRGVMLSNDSFRKQSSLPSTENAIRNLQGSSNVPRKVCIRFTNFRRQSEKAFTL